MVSGCGKHIKTILIKSKSLTQLHINESKLHIEDAKEILVGLSINKFINEVSLCDAEFTKDGSTFLKRFNKK